VIASENRKRQIVGASGVVLAAGKNHSMGKPDEIAISVSVRRHQTGHRRGPAIMTSRNGRYLVLVEAGTGGRMGIQWSRGGRTAKL